ncbi:PGF-pre-PGF domain-containing protein [Halorussus salinisoli]|uniref:PGF-pre-PGF domain-containing protein n=1 Tax=Halorussus salinisoli TaxID=2558242 RepID=UPI0010C1D272|nr:PGF-pre-PGF domain-containing protein [Halorussus salinisoli]
MIGGSKPDPGCRLTKSTQILAVLAVVLVVGASVTATVGVALGDPTGSAGDRLVPSGEQSGPDMPNGTDNETDDSSDEVLLPTETTTQSDDLDDEQPGVFPFSNQTTNGTTSIDPNPGRPSNPGGPTDPGEPSDPGNSQNRTGPLGDPTESEAGLPANRTADPGDRAPNATDRGNGTPPGRSDAKTVNVSVENAYANESVSVNVSTPDERDRNVSFSTIGVTPTRDANFTLNVTASEEPIADETPTEPLSNGTEPLSFLSVDHSISDRNISNVTFTFRVRRDRVNASERDQISLYRYHDESWNELPTTLTATTESHYVYRVRSPGLSEFAAGKKTPQFEITNATVELTTLSVGDALEVRVRVTNRGDADGTFSAELVLDGESVADRQLTIAAGGMRQTTFEHTIARAGTYDVYVNQFRVGEVNVNGTTPTGDGSTSAGPTDGGATGERATDSDASARDGTDADVRSDTTASVPGFCLAAGVAGLLAALYAVGRRQR